MYYYHGNVQHSGICPYRYKSDLVDWAANKWPNEPISKYEKMHFNQLKAIWYNTTK